jgi:hypothetical protein
MTDKGWQRELDDPIPLPRGRCDPALQGENGQRFPIILGKHEDREVIVDGRNPPKASSTCREDALLLKRTGGQEAACPQRGLRRLAKPSLGHLLAAEVALFFQHMIDGAYVDYVGCRDLVLILAAEMSHPNIDGFFDRKLGFRCSHVRLH